MTSLTVVVGRDATGRLHGTIERGPTGAPVVRFTGVIEMVAQIEASLDQPGPADGPSADGAGEASASEDRG